MKLLKGFLFAITGLFIVITLFSLLMPSRIMTTHSITLRADSNAVKMALTNYNTWKQWHPIFRQGQQTILIQKEPGRVGHSAAWISNERKQFLEITEITGSQIRMRLKSESENDTDYLFSLTSMNQGNAIQLNWNVFYKLKWYPWEKFAGIFLDKATRPGYEQALQNFKDFIESASIATQGN